MKIEPVSTFTTKNEKKNMDSVAPVWSSSFKVFLPVWI